MKTKILFSIIIMGISINSLFGQQKEDIYISPIAGKFPGYWLITFAIIKDSTLVKSIRYDVEFSYKNKKIKDIQKRNFRATDRFKYEKMENGNIWVKYSGSDQRTVTDVDYYTTENFRKTERYKYFKQYLLELAEMDNYEMLVYLDKNFTKYYGPKEYRDVPVLKKVE